MKYAWFHAFTTSTTPADSTRVMRGKSRQYRDASFRRTLRAMFTASFLFAVILFVQGNVVVAQELDSATLQKQVEEEAAAKAKQSQQQPPASQAQPPQAANPQDQPQSSHQQASQPPTMQPLVQMPQGYPAQPGQYSFMLPPGTKLPLGLLRPLKLKSGKDIYLQITFPVTVGNQMVVPPGTYIQGVVGKVIRKDRRREKLEFEIRSANMIFLNGYTVPIAGTVNIVTTNAALQPRRNGLPVAAMAAVGAATTPALPPLPDIGKTARTAMIAIGVVGAVAITAGIVIAANRDPEIEVGTPLEIVLPAPVFLDAGRVMAAVQQFTQQASNAPVQIVQPPVKPKMCYDPGSPGTSDTVIPGSPGTPDTVIPGVNGMPDTVIPGSPRTPDTVIPGTPGTPSSTYPCPR